MENATEKVTENATVETTVEAAENVMEIAVPTRIDVDNC